jgi:hypothetical protein
MGMGSEKERKQRFSKPLGTAGEKDPNCLNAPLALRTGEPKHGKTYTYAVDTLATVSFWTPVAMAQEVFVAGLTVPQSLKVRGISIAVNLAVARPYGIYRDMLFRLLRTDTSSSQNKRYWTDYIAFSSFWTPVYIGMLAVAGSDHHQIAKAVGSGLISNLFTGRPFGAYFDFVRRKAGLKAAWEKAS